jgi:hypothetical protein
VRVVLGVNETIATLVKNDLLDRDLVLDWRWMAGTWDRFWRRPSAPGSGPARRTWTRTSRCSQLSKRRSSMKERQTARTRHELVRYPDLIVTRLGGGLWVRGASARAANVVAGRGHRIAQRELPGPLTCAAVVLRRGAMFAAEGWSTCGTSSWSSTGRLIGSRGEGG